MNIEKRYQNAEKLMPWNTKNLALNINPYTKFSDNFLIYSTDYFYKGKVKTKYNKIDLTTFDIKPYKFKDEFVKEEYHEDYTNKKYSPDKKYAIFVKDYNVFLESKGKTKQLTFDGTKDNSYADIIYQRVYHTKYLKNNPECSVLFSPDSKKALIAKTKKENVGKLCVTQSFNKDSFKPMRPKTYEYDDWFLYEDYKIESKYIVIDLENCSLKEIDEAYSTPEMVEFNTMWDKDSNGFIHLEYSKCDKEKKLYHVSLVDYKSTLLAKEATNTFFFDESIVGAVSPKYCGPFYMLDNCDLLWWSNFEDNGAIYLIDKDTKEVGKRITSLNYNVSQILTVKDNTIYFMASKFDFLSEPYYNVLCKIDLDSKNFECLTKEDAFHEVKINKDATYYTDTYSRSDLPTKCVLRSIDNKYEKVLSEANIDKLLKAGYQIPKRIKVYSSKACCDLYGIIVLPKDYNESKKYPVIDYVYGGMQIVNAPKTFTTYGSIPGRECFGGLESFAALGFIGVVLDGPGTPFRGKKFHDISYQNMGECSGLFYHPEVIEELAKEYKGIDLDHVGIWGNSAGGYATVRALCLRPDFYKVGVSSAGDHDNQIYSASWAERFNGPYDKEVYKKQDSARIVDKLEGKLMLAHGLLDDNVNPSQTFRLIEFLEKANKEYDLVVLPDTDHNVPANPYFLRRRFDYFVKNLLGVEPPHNYSFNHPFFNYKDIKD